MEVAGWLLLVSLFVIGAARCWVAVHSKTHRVDDWRKDEWWR